MFIAIDKDSNRVEIENADKIKEYFCPVCGEKLSIRAKESIAVKTHFAHKRNSQCVDDWNHDMSEWHLNWQRRFPTECREVVIEHNGIKHRADICIGNTIIEFQHSPLSSEEFGKRNEFYTNCGYKVVWVFDADEKIKNPYDEDNTLDPIKNRFNKFIWKRAKETFSKPIHNNVGIYLEYKTTLTLQDKRYENMIFNIMIPITRISPKLFEFFKTHFYIRPNNFLKDYGICSDEETLSATQIIQQTPRSLNGYKIQ